MYPSHITVRLAVDSDTGALTRLAALDSAALPAGPTLLAERNGETVAALPVNGGGAIADPFRRTTGIIELLELRATQLRRQESSPRGRLRDLVRTWRALSLR